MNIVKHQQFNDTDIATIKATVAKDATTSELNMFLNVSSTYGLNPFSKEIWFIKIEGQPNIMTSRDGYLKIAHNSGQFESLSGGVVYENDTFEMGMIDGKQNLTHKFSHKDRGNIIGAWACVKRKDCNSLFYSYVPLSDYYKDNKIWKKYTYAMILKVAETFVLKRAFGISGLITKEEMPDVYDIDHTVVEDSPTKEQLDEIKLLFDSNAHLLSDKELQYPNNLKSYDKAASCLEWIKKVSVERNQPVVIETQVTTNLEDLI